jgi:hypothetical protein
MRPTKNLVQLRQKTSHTLSKLRTLADRASGLPTAATNQTLAYVTIECQTTVWHFMRAYFLSCTLSPITESGVTITCASAIRTFDDAVNASMRRLKPSIAARLTRVTLRDEPPWHNTDTLLNSCDAISCSNYADIQAALSLPTKAFKHLTKFRNFYAHRNEETLKIAKDIASYYTIPTNGHPSQILCTTAYGRPQILILDWLDDIRLTIELLCK